uniref:C2H2-type domain-containing protein n=2 Tax=Lutzomyia longipalpis TaxID=7200 RepID=A0A1B0CDS8_LUTLO
EEEDLIENPDECNSVNSVLSLEIKEEKDSFDDLHEEENTDEKLDGGFSVFFPEKMTNLVKDEENPEMRKKRIRMKPKKPLRDVKDSDYRESESLFACNKCGKKYLTREALMVHLSCHLTNAPRECRCRFCFENFPTQFHLRDHIKKRHSDEIKKEEEERLTAKPVQVWQCKFCSKTFTLRSSYRKHLEIHTMGKDRICDVCGKGFRQMSNLKEHLKIHSDEKMYKCTIADCNRAYKQKTALKFHLKCHSDDKPFPCEYCGKHFKDKSYLKVS